MKSHQAKRLLLLCFALLFVGCGPSTHDAIFQTDSAATRLRSMQSRAFDTTDKARTLRIVIATLQDLAFVVDAADAAVGTVSATKLDDYELRVTVTVRPRGSTQLFIRANFQFDRSPVEEPEAYQAFFASLSKAMFLEAHSVR